MITGSRDGAKLEALLEVKIFESRSAAAQIVAALGQEIEPPRIEWWIGAVRPTHELILTRTFPPIVETREKMSARHEWCDRVRIRDLLAGEGGLDEPRGSGSVAGTACREP